MKTTKKLSPLAASLTMVALTFLASIAIGPVLIPPNTLVTILASKLPGVAVDPYWPESFNTILFSVRLPHAALILITGAALGGSGAAYQGVFRNPLADPYLIGVASGAGLGAIVAMSIQWPNNLLGMYTVPLAAFLGALAAVAAVYSVARLGNTLPTTA